MANRMFNQFQGSLEKGVVQLYAEVAFDASGVGTITRAKGIASISNQHGGVTGAYRLILQDSYVRMLGFTANVQVLGNNGTLAIVYPSSLTDVTDPANPFVHFVNIQAGNLVNLVSRTAFFVITLSNSTAL